MAKQQRFRTSKKLRVLLGVIAIILVGGLIFLFSYTYSVSGKIIDISNKQVVKGIKVSVGGKSRETDEQGSYKIKGIKIYQKKNLKLDTPNQYEKVADIKLDFKSRNIQKDLELEPTLEEIVNRDLIAGKNGQYDYLWDLLHPDDRAYWGSKEEYLNTLKKRDDLYAEIKYTVKSATIGKNIRKLDTWKSEVTGKEYKEVMEVPEDYIMVDNGKEQPQTILVYYQRIDGYYHYFTGVNKDEVKKWIEDYEKYKEALSSL